MAALATEVVMLHFHKLQQAPAASELSQNKMFSIILRRHPCLQAQ